MSAWRSTRASRVLRALERIGWSIKRQRGSHRVLQRPGLPDVVFAFHDRDEIGPRMLSRVAKHTGLTSDEPRRVPRRRFRLSHATMASSVDWTWKRASASAGGMFDAPSR